MQTSKNLTYKKAMFHNDTSNRTLQQYLETALKKLPSAFSRRQGTDSTIKCFRMLNYNSPYKGLIVGEVIDYTVGNMQTFTKIEKELPELPLNSLKAPDESEFIDSLLYFGVLDDHVLIVQSASLRSKQFEDYINWLLLETKSIRKDQFVNFVDQIPNALKSNISKTSKVQLSAPVHFSASDNSQNEDVATSSVTKIDAEELGTRKLTFTPRGAIWQTIRAMIPKELELPESLNVDDMAKNKELVVKLELSWKGARKQDSSTLLDTISNQLRHVDTEIDYQISTKSGQTITKEMIKLSKSVSVTVQNEGLLQRGDLWFAMHEWISQLIEEKRVYN